MGKCIKCGVEPAWWEGDDIYYCDKHHEIYKKLKNPKRYKYADPDGNPAEYSSPIDVNNQIYFCGVPFRLDTYNGCTHGCKYCFVRAAEVTSASRGNRGNFIVPANSADVLRELNTALNTTIERESIVVEWMRRRVPIHWGGMSDPFQPAEKKFQVSLRVLEALSWYNYPTVISSKGILAMRDEYLELLKEGTYAYQVTLVSDDEDFVGALEPGAPSPKERMHLLESLAHAGIWTAVRIQPVIPNTIIEQHADSFIKRLADIGVKHILPEGYKVPVRAEEEMKYIWNLCPDAYHEYQYLDVNSEGFEKILPTWRKWKYVKEMKEIANSYGLTYGAADNDLRDFGDTICCCGIDRVPGFENFWRYQASQAADIAKKKGWVSLEDMQEFWSGEKAFSIHNDVLRLQRKAETGMSKVTPKYAVDEMWKRGDEQMSPNCMVSMVRSQRDGELVYEWRDPVEMLEKKEVKQEKMF